jgi:hypothetical protein
VGAVRFCFQLVSCAPALEPSLRLVSAMRADRKSVIVVGMS